ncbi:MAG: heat-inducible transcriptional repressor HrcA [Solirubrobacterales bacterium]
MEPISLTDRQQSILRLVVATHLDSGRPVGSRALAEDGTLECRPSTIRAELAALEDVGLLEQPHTSAGRIPTESAYRAYAEDLIETVPRPPLPAPAPSASITHMRREVDEALHETTFLLSRTTELVALATAPPLATASIRRVEVLPLQPNSVMVVVITSTGGVAKRVFTFERRVDPGLVEWAGSYLNERLSGLGLGARMLAGRLDDETLGAAERCFVDAVAPAFGNLEEAAEQSLYLDGTAHLLAGDREVPDLEELMRTLERRVGLLSVLRTALERDSVFMWIGSENPRPELRGVSMVGANYGLGWRNLGTVGVIGPLRMDYAAAIEGVQTAAGELSQYFETVYEA